MGSSFLAVSEGISSIILCPYGAQECPSAVYGGDQWVTGSNGPGKRVKVVHVLERDGRRLVLLFTFSFRPHSWSTGESLGGPGTPV